MFLLAFFMVGVTFMLKWSTTNNFVDESPAMVVYQELLLINMFSVPVGIHIHFQFHEYVEL